MSPLLHDELDRAYERLLTKLAAAPVSAHDGAFLAQLAADLACWGRRSALIGTPATARERLLESAVLAVLAAERLAPQSAPCRSQAAIVP